VGQATRYQHDQWLGRGRAAAELPDADPDTGKTADPPPDAAPLASPDGDAVPAADRHAAADGDAARDEPARHRAADPDVHSV